MPQKKTEETKSEKLKSAKIEIFVKQKIRFKSGFFLFVFIQKELS